MQSVAESAGNFIVVDGAPGFGRDTGMPPMHLLLLGAAGCSAMDVVHILKNRMRRPVMRLRLEVKAEEHPSVYARIELKCLVKGRDLKEKDVVRAIQLSNSKFCSASIMLDETAKIVTSYEIEEES